jgi:hypothetical protein
MTVFVAGRRFKALIRSYQGSIKALCRVVEDDGVGGRHAQRKREREIDLMPCPPDRVLNRNTNIDGSD